MYQYPLKFRLNATAGDGVQQAWTSASAHYPDQTLDMAIPPEFNGPGKAFSPEDLYGLAMLNCFIATFKVVAQASAFRFEKIEAALELVADKNEQGQPWLARAHLQATLFGPSNPEKAERLMTKAAQACLVLNSIKTDKTFDFRVA